MMINLLATGYSKLFRNLAFRVCLIVMTVIPMFLTSVAVMKSSPAAGPLNGIYNTGMMFIGLLTGGFVSLFISQDYMEKTINNKIMAGYSRTAIYLSDLIVTITGTLIMQLTCIVASSLIAIPCRGMYNDSFSRGIGTQLIIFCVISVYAALVLLICTIINSKSYAVAVSMIAMILMLIAGIAVYDMVASKNDAPAAQTEITTEDKIAEKLSFVLPQSQMYVVMDKGLTAKTAKMIGFDVISVTVMSLAGLLIFKRKDIK
ncbi:MAG: ABC transporter permease subunit [Ruminococcus sp.]|nr:ABC transporter permease subunit [Ruminococcus sp.]